MIGGATTSELHTALKIAPVYSAPVLWMKDASQNTIAAAHLLNKELRNEYVQKSNRRYEQLRAGNATTPPELLSLEEARKRKPNLF